MRGAGKGRDPGWKVPWGGRCHVRGVRRVPGNGLEEAWPKVGARKMGPAEERADLGTLKH